MINKDNKDKFEIPPEGNLGLLALGHIGLIAWRKKRDETIAKRGIPNPFVIKTTVDEKEDEKK
ncbi:MAG: hypothetical protein ACK4K0_08380 [Flavobacteriales bacterium]